jgi:hypothetical protein
MTREPLYEVWFSNLSKQSEWDGGRGEFVEDCYSLEEAHKAVRECSKGGNCSWIIDKYTREMFTLPIECIYQT